MNSVDYSQTDITILLSWLVHILYKVKIQFNLPFCSSFLKEFFLWVLWFLFFLCCRKWLLATGVLGKAHKFTDWSVWGQCWEPLPFCSWGRFFFPQHLHIHSFCNSVSNLMHFPIHFIPHHPFWRLGIWEFIGHLLARGNKCFVKPGFHSGFMSSVSWVLVHQRQRTWIFCAMVITSGLWVKNSETICWVAGSRCMCGGYWI